MQNWPNLSVVMARSGRAGHWPVRAFKCRPDDVENGPGTGPASIKARAATNPQKMQKTDYFLARKKQNYVLCKQIFAWYHSFVRVLSWYGKMKLFFQSSKKVFWWIWWFKERSAGRHYKRRHHFALVSARAWPGGLTLVPRHKGPSQATESPTRAGARRCGRRLGLRHHYLFGPPCRRALLLIWVWSYSAKQNSSHTQTIATWRSHIILTRQITVTISLDDRWSCDRASLSMSSLILWRLVTIGGDALFSFECDPSSVMHCVVERGVPWVYWFLCCFLIWNTIVHQLLVKLHKVWPRPFCDLFSAATVRSNTSHRGRVVITTLFAPSTARAS